MSVPTVQQYRSQLSKELHAPYRGKFPKLRVTSAGPNDIWAIDLCDFQNVTSSNDNYRYGFVTVDVYSRYAWVVPLRSKTASETLGALSRVIAESSGKPRAIWCDSGGEFLNKSWKAFCKKHSIEIYTTYGDSKSVIAERFNRTLKTTIHKRFTEYATNSWIDMLPEVLELYNNRRHRSIGTAPAEQYKSVPKEVEHKPLAKSDRRKPKYDIGSYVRIHRSKRVFEKGYSPNWSEEVFIVSSVKVPDDGSPMSYYLIDKLGEPIGGMFYEGDLQGVKYPNLHFVDAVLKTRKVRGKSEAFVSWVGLPEKFNQWIPQSDIRTSIPKKVVAQ
jgi:hypothetical protein